MFTSRTQTAITHRVGALQASSLDYILLDGSSSMMGKWWNCLGALERYVSNDDRIDVGEKFLCP